MSKEKNIDVNIELGQVIDISLESMMGSTGYGWELSELTGPVYLIGISVIPSSTKAVAPVTQVFHVRGIKTGKAKVSFVLTAPWKLEEPVNSVTYNIEVVEVKAVTDDELKIKGFVDAPKASVRDQQKPSPLYDVQAPDYEYSQFIDLWHRLYYGTLPPRPCASDPRLYYGVRCAPSVLDQNDIRMYYAVRAPLATCEADPRVYYGVCCAPAALDLNDIRPYYAVRSPMAAGVCSQSEPDYCGTPPQIYKYGILPMPLYNVNGPFAKYNIPPMMRYNFPNRCE